MERSIYRNDLDQNGQQTVIFGTKVTKTVTDYVQSIGGLLRNLPTPLYRNLRFNVRDLLGIMMRESRMNPVAKNPRSTAFGYSQFLSGTYHSFVISLAKSVGVTDIYKTRMIAIASDIWNVLNGVYISSIQLDQHANFKGFALRAESEILEKAGSFRGPFNFANRDFFRPGSSGPKELATCVRGVIGYLKSARGRKLVESLYGIVRAQNDPIVSKADLLKSVFHDLSDMKAQFIIMQSLIATMLITDCLFEYNARIAMSLLERSSEWRHAIGQVRCQEVLDDDSVLIIAWVAHHVGCGEAPRLLQAFIQDVFDKRENGSVSLNFDKLIDKLKMVKSKACHVVPEKRKALYFDVGVQLKVAAYFYTAFCNEIRKEVMDHVDH